MTKPAALQLHVSPFRMLPSVSLITRPLSPSYDHIRWSHSSSNPQDLTHIDPKTGRARMVDVSHKEVTQRSATAVGRIIIPKHAYELIVADSTQKPPIADPQQNALTPDQEQEEATPIQRKGKPGKGDVLTTAQIAGIMAAKRTSDLIPLCHPLPITHIEVVLEPSVQENPPVYSVKVHATVRTASRTGVEMEALTAANVALLTVWDMLKAVAGQHMMIEGVCVSRKEGGASGLFERADIL